MWSYLKTEINQHGELVRERELKGHCLVQSRVFFSPTVFAFSYFFYFLSFFLANVVFLQLFFCQACTVHNAAWDCHFPLVDKYTCIA